MTQDKRYTSIFKRAEELEKENPDLKSAMRLLDISMKEYQQALDSLEPSATFTSNSTAPFKKT